MTFQKGHKINVGRKHKPRSEEHKKNISNSNKGKSPWNMGLSGKNYSKHYIEGHPKGMKGKKNKWGNHTQESKIKISAFQQGISVEEWNGFKVSKNRFLKNTAKYQIWRNFIFLRDNFTCKNPNCEFCENEIGVYLHAHHIKSLKYYPELVFDVNNGITYCKDFHIKSNLHKNMQKEC